VGVGLVVRQGGVAPVGADGVGVGAGLDGAGVVTGGQCDGGDAVHDALVVGGRPVRVGLGQGGGGDHVPHDLGSAELVGGQGGVAAHEALVGLVGQDAQQRAPAGQLGDAWGERLGHGVDRVGAHRVAHVD